ncbi:hypothetical protein T265_02859 [Opisthorchis viverrini]|uniref:Uncharacterized protein n=1 Tax=Opisthorchis viverrini TaxID=6198 RepID=A0A074ZXX1_OPIVI|nr:hypothetical protein T265_02859 [Opisthorchis viverrini]KER30822.1 hypothetical protein T265_02859 [Opisthorchis viverrini]
MQYASYLGSHFQTGYKYRPQARLSNAPWTFQSFVNPHLCEDGFVQPEVDNSSVASLGHVQYLVQ